ncbi:ABC transporter permease [Humitalea sp. 24SJ18S-53]|uniref:ABC transporter permease n=1 Tax=Humitalea sp. 24SJ18S-53 TaxID=3422307 RepID=UPI003D66CC4D
MIGSLALGRLGRVSVMGVLLAIIAVLVLSPLAMTAIASFSTEVPFSGGPAGRFTLGNYSALFVPELGIAIGNTLVIAAGGTVIAVAIGCSLAWLAARTDIPCKPLVHLVGLMPLFVSLVVASVTWAVLGSGRSGYINIILRGMGFDWQIDMRSLAGITLVHGLYYVPYSYILLYGALSLIHPDLEQAASVHGASNGRMLRRITFPLVRPALLGAILLSFVAMAEEFPVPAILGGPVGIETLSTRIFNLMTRVPGEPNQAAAVGILLTALVSVLVYWQRKLLKGRDYRTVTGKGMRPQLMRLGRFRWPALALVLLYAFIAMGLPLMALAIGALRQGMFIRDVAALFNPAAFSLDTLRATLLDEHVRHAVANTLITGVATAILGTTLYFILAYVFARTRLPGRQTLEYMAMVPLALPALVMGIGTLWTWLAVPLPIYGTLFVLIIAFTGRLMPQGVRAISASISQIHDDLEEAAMVSGATRARAVVRITLPLMRGAVVSSAFLTLVLATRELTSSLLLYTTNTRVLSVVIYEAYEQGLWSTVASISLVYTALLLVLTLIGRRWMRTSF